MAPSKLDGDRDRNSDRYLYPAGTGCSGFNEFP
jgi:hypothetical protein